jgi:hypothetical protein
MTDRGIIQRLARLIPLLADWEDAGALILQIGDYPASDASAKRELRRDIGYLRQLGFVVGRRTENRHALYKITRGPC